MTAQNKNHVEIVYFKMIWFSQKLIFWWKWSFPTKNSYWRNTDFIMKICIFSFKIWSFFGHLLNFDQNNPVSIFKTFSWKFQPTYTPTHSNSASMAHFRFNKMTKKYFQDSKILQFFGIKSENRHFGPKIGPKLFQSLIFPIDS